MQRFLDVVERIGNRVPHPSIVFLVLIVVIIALSHLFFLLGTTVEYQVVDPLTHQIRDATSAVRSLITIEGRRFMLTSVIPNFLGFTAVGMVIVAMVGVGLAEESGLIRALIRKLVLVSPPATLTYILVFAGILSSIAADAGYLVLIPLAAVAYQSVGRHPVAGLAAAFAAVGGAFGVNMLIKPVDGVLTEITNDAIHLVNPSLSIDLAANLFFSIVSVVVLTLVIALVSDRFVEPRLGAWQGPRADDDDKALSPEELRGLRFALFGFLSVIVVFTLLTAPAGASLRDPVTGAIIGDTPFMNSLIVIVTALFFGAGLAYGIGAGTITSANDVVKAIVKTIGSLSELIFLLLIISQFVAYFSYTNLATVAAVELGDLLQYADLGAGTLLAAFVAVVFLVGILMPQIIPKWALFAPVFVPLFMRLGIEPDAVLAAYRVGDSPSNVINPLMPYFALIVTFVRRYDQSAGVGTVIALMLPYAVALLGVWIVLLLAWHAFGIPFGPG
ncbi:MAG: AbgT family transporter [Steroidobacteraceae bacterium]|nr:AbgT family transporter [Steroidobacteraceae bacterium]